MSLYELEKPWFKRYRLDMLTEWHDEESRVADANRNLKKIGRPWMAIILPVIFTEERQLLRSLCPGENAPVTVQTLNKRLNHYFIYNGMMQWPDFDNETDIDGRWDDVRINIIDLVRVASFSRAFDISFGV